jgi:predicted N-acetyltransferase YhbS
MNTIVIRPATPADFAAISKVIELAFQNDLHSDHKEHILVERLRKSAAFIPELSLVAVLGDTIVGHILLTRITVDEKYPSLLLFPVTVHPKYQGRKIGASLIQEAHRIAKELGFTSILLVGQEGYYPRFGYKLLSSFGIRIPCDVPDEFCMGVELVPDALKGVQGTVVYPPEFFSSPQ